MPTLTYVNMIFLGTFASVDETESDFNAEGAADLLGSYSDLTMTVVGEHDRDDSGSIEDDDNGMGGRTGADRDFLDYDVGFGYEEYEIDSTISYSADILLGDGSTITRTVAVIQTTIGDVFVRDVGDGLDNLDIQNITLTSVNNNDYSGSFTNQSIENSRFVCLCTGTRITTPQGDIAVEDLQTLSKVQTIDGPDLPILWRTHGPVPQARSARPIQFETGSLSETSPTHTLRLSPNHRLMVRSTICKRMFGADSVLLPAKRFTAAPGISQSAPRKDEQYWNLLLPRHAVILANGAPVESFFPGTEALRALPRAHRATLRPVLGKLRTPSGLGYLPAATIPPGHAQRSLIRRHLKNKRPFLSPNAAKTAAACG